MKRFYCTICKRVKRVQNLPSNISNSNATVVKARVGSCNKHYESPRRKSA